jgi:transcriptional regulator with XRE-family HTH domain
MTDNLSEDTSAFGLNHDHLKVAAEPGADMELLRTALRRLMLERGLSLRMLAELLAVDPAVISHVLAGGELDSGSAVRILCSAVFRPTHQEQQALLRISRLSTVVMRFTADDVTTGPPVDAPLDWPQFRIVTVAALRSLGLSLRAVARLSDLTAGSLSRFLRAETMSLEALSVLKLYLALRDVGLTAEVGRRLLLTSGTFELAVLLRRAAQQAVAAEVRRDLPKVTIPKSFDQLHADTVLGADGLAASSARELYDRAMAEYHRDWPQTIALLSQVERAADAPPQLRALALMTMIMPLSSLGRYRQAAGVIRRIELEMLPVMSDALRVEFYYHRSFLLMQEQNPLGALRSLETALKAARDGEERERLIERSAHHYGMLYRRLARLEGSPIRRRQQLEKAVHLLQLESRPAVSSGHDLRIGFNLLRSAQVYRALGDAGHAARLRRRAAVLFRGTHAEAHIALEEANLALRFETLDYARAGVRFQSAYETWRNLGYLGGQSRALSGLGLVRLQDGDAGESLSMQLAALLIHPEGDETMEIQSRMTEAFEDLRRQRGLRWTVGLLRDQIAAARAADGWFGGLHWDERHDELAALILRRFGAADAVLPESTRIP